MAHYAELDENNVVLRVIVVSNDDAGPLPGIAGEQFCSQLLGGRWKQTSYNTLGGVHYNPTTNEPDDGVPFRKNYAGIGSVYDETRDAFYAPAPYPSWVLNEETCQWNPPVTFPTDPAPDGYTYQWNEPTTDWALVAYTPLSSRP